MPRHLPSTPHERHDTVRQALRRALERQAYTAHDLSSEIHISEREVIPHLEHLQRSLKRGPWPLHVEPAECLACAFRFEERQRLSCPGSCPRCRSRRIDPPLFSIPTD